MHYIVEFIFQKFIIATGNLRMHLPFGKPIYKQCKCYCFYHVLFYLNSSRNFDTAWKVSKYGVFSGPYFPVFRLITETYSKWGKYRPEKFPYLDTFHAVWYIQNHISLFLWTLSVVNKHFTLISNIKKTRSTERGLNYDSILIEEWQMKKEYGNIQ